jgi:DNA modification methylase
MPQQRSPTKTIAAPAAATPPVEPPRQPLPDIKPQTPVASLDRAAYAGRQAAFAVGRVAPVVGLSPLFVRKVVGSKRLLAVDDVLRLLDQDAFAETFVPRSKVIEHLLSLDSARVEKPLPETEAGFALVQEDALAFLKSLPARSVQCVVTSTPYWALRLYKGSANTKWADGATCPYGHEQTPEGFIRHSAELLGEIFRVLTDDGSVWWNVMDSFNTRTQIRGNAAEALRAMQGKDKRTWLQHDCRRYSAGHAFLKDGEQCLIPGRIAERATRLGFYLKTMITWAKTSTLPEPQESRVSRNLEYILHLSKVRKPRFHKKPYRELAAALGGRNNGWETDKLSDVWTLPTSSGRDGHGAQFPIALPARCIAISSNPGDIVLDPFVGAGNSGVAAVALGRRFVGVDVAPEYLETAKRKIETAKADIEAAKADRDKLPLERVAAQASGEDPFG